jgi:uncharacterized protein (DUF362 family)
MVSRRNFLRLGGSLSLSGLLAGCHPSEEHYQVSEAQKAGRHQGVSKVAIATCKSYEEDLLALLKSFAADLTLPNLEGKTVLIKPNMVDFVPSLPLTTNPAVLAAAVKFCDHLGARRIIVGEGPAHNRDTEYILEHTGIGKTCKQLGVPFVDLNLDDLSAVDNKNPITGIERFYLAKSVVEADAVISLPKLKTHHWARLTASMKNLFGTVPGRKYGWPKNLLHVAGIDKTIVDLTRLIRPQIQIVDAVEAMEGDGPLNGTTKLSHFLLLGTDPAAVDATAARIMGITPDNVPYLRLAGQVVGNINEDEIKIIGAPLSEVASQFQMPVAFTADGRLKNDHDFKEAANAGST